MNPYPKIQTIFKRDPENKYRTLLWDPPVFACPEFAYLADNIWVWTEKVDGTNIRVMWDGEQVRFGGKTDRAQLYMPLIEKLQEMFPAEKMIEILGDDGSYCLYGEGYGARIQKGGGNYIPDGVGFILFDVLVGDDLWLKREDVEDIAEKLGIQTVGIVSKDTLWNAVRVIRSGMIVSGLAAIPNTQMEGLVLRPAVELRNRRGGRIITKIKCKDFPR